LVAGAKVEVRKKRNKGYDFFLKKIRGRTRFEERYNNRSPATAPEMLVGVS
jgi:hypothetical protein